MLLARQPVFQGEYRHPEGIEKFSGLPSLRTEDQFAKPPARSDHHGAAIGLARGRPEHGDRWIVDVAHPPVLRSFRLILAAFETRRAIFPKMDDLRLRLRQGGQGEPESDQNTEVADVHDNVRTFEIKNTQQTLKGKTEQSWATTAEHDLFAGVQAKSFFKLPFRKAV